MPLHYNYSDHTGTLATYYGSEEQVKKLQPYGLLESIAKEGTSREEVGIPSKFLTLLSEWDPVDDITKPTEEFVNLVSSLKRRYLLNDLWTVSVMGS